MRNRYLVLALFFLLAGQSCLANSAWHTIHNDFYWVDQNGERVMTRSGCLCQFDGLYYWYGGTQANLHREQYCYTSPDLVHWMSHGVVLRHDVEANRIDVVYNRKTQPSTCTLETAGSRTYRQAEMAITSSCPWNSKTIGQF